MTDPSNNGGGSDQGARPQSSRQRYRVFVDDYKHKRLDEKTEALSDQRLLTPAPADAMDAKATGKKTPKPIRSAKRREYLREYIRWLWPYRFAVGSVFLLAALVAGIQMVEPLFMRYIIDKVLLNKELDTQGRLLWLNIGGAAFLGVIILSSLLNVVKDYRQRILNTRVMLSLRRSLFDRLLHLPLPRLWDMKTGGILSRLTGDIDTTTGLLQMAIVSPALSVIRLIVAITVLMTLNWRLALTAMAIIPGAMLMSFVSASRIRPIYRAIRKDVELIDGRVGETFTGIRVVRAFGREVRALSPG